jgi:hypothetical protein
MPVAYRFPYKCLEYNVFFDVFNGSPRNFQELSDGAGLRLAGRRTQEFNYGNAVSGRAFT